MSITSLEKQLAMFRIKHCVFTTNMFPGNKILRGGLPDCGILY
jgi:hypothetical protein